MSMWARSRPQRGDGIMSNKKKKDTQCFMCEGSGKRCNQCGETESVCQCDDGFESIDCADCNGTGK